MHHFKYVLPFPPGLKSFYVASAVLFQQSFTCRGAAGASGRGGPCLGAWEPWGHQDQGCPCPPAIPRQLQGGPGCPPEGQLWSASARAGGLQGRLWLSPGLAPLAAQALSRSPLKTGRSTRKVKTGNVGHTYPGNRLGPALPTNRPTRLDTMNPV